MRENSILNSSPRTGRFVALVVVCVSVGFLLNALRPAYIAATTMSSVISTEPPIAFAIHGGAGSPETSPETQTAVRAALTQALTAGHAILKSGGSALDAVEAALRILEDSPYFNAGKGAVVTASGTFELDASIMDGANLRAGAVAGVKHIKNPISLARLVMTNSPHVMLVGDGAEVFARSQGMDTVPNTYFRTESQWKIYERQRDDSATKKGSLNSSPQALVERKYGTVGAVALDRNGNLVAGTSTGGTSLKRWGRVGDSPIIGAGTYASNEAGCAVSATGVGEYFIRNTVAVDICKRVEYLRESIDSAAAYVILGKLVAQGGRGGVIAMDRTGRVTQPFNTPAMYRAYIDAAGHKVVAVGGANESKAKP